MIESPFNHWVIMTMFVHASTKLSAIEPEVQLGDP